MRTRRSPRNQERLWRALGGEAPATTPAQATAGPVETATRILDRARSDPFTSQRTLRMLERDLAAARRREALERKPTVHVTHYQQRIIELTVCTETEARSVEAYMRLDRGVLDGLVDFDRLAHECLEAVRYNPTAAEQLAKSYGL